MALDVQERSLAGVCFQSNCPVRSCASALERPARSLGNAGGAQRGGANGGDARRGGAVVGVNGAASVPLLCIDVLASRQDIASQARSAPSPRPAPVQWRPCTGRRPRGTRRRLELVESVEDSPGASGGSSCAARIAGELKSAWCSPRTAGNDNLPRVSRRSSDRNVCVRAPDATIQINLLRKVGGPLTLTSESGGTIFPQ